MMDAGPLGGSTRRCLITCAVAIGFVGSFIVALAAPGAQASAAQASGATQLESRVFGSVRVTPKRVVFRPNGLRPRGVRAARVILRHRNRQASRAIKVQRVRRALRRGSPLRVRRATLKLRARTAIAAPPHRKAKGWLRVRGRDIDPPEQDPGSGEDPLEPFPPPDTTITSGASGTIASTSATFAFISSQEGSHFECRLDGGGWSGCASPATYPNLSQGPHTFEVRAVHAVNGTDPTPASRSFTVDTVAPTTTITSGPSGTITSTSASFAFAASEQATFQCRLDGSAWAACASPRSYSNLAQGSHTFAVRATDAAGNVGAAASRSFTVDTTPSEPAEPSGLISNGSFESGLTGWSGHQSAPTVRDGGPDGQSYARVAAQSGVSSYSLVTSPRPVTNPVEGTRYELDAWARSNGAKSVCLRLREWSGSTVIGSAQSCQAATSWQRFDTVRYTAAGGSSIDVYAYQLSAASGDSFDLDGVSLFDEEPAVAPTTTITSGPSGTITSTSASFAFAASEQATFQCRLDGSAWAACASPRSYSNLAQGSHTFAVRATDAAGNVGAAASRSFTVDTTPSEPRPLSLDDVSSSNVMSIWGDISAASPSRHTWHGSGGPGGGPYREYVVHDGDRYRIFYPDGSTYEPSDAAERAEVGRNDSRDNGSRTFALYREGQRRVTEFWIRLPDRSLVDQNRWIIFLQQKQTQPHPEGGGSPVISLQVAAGRFRLRMTDAPGGSSNSEVWSTPAQTGTWLRGFTDVTYSSDPAKGRIQVGIGSAVSPVFTRHTLKRASNGDSIPGHLRVGIYRDPAISNTSRVQFGRVSVHQPG